MTIKTLSHIRDLLIEDEEKKRKARDWQRQIWLKADEEDAPNKDGLKEIYDHLRDDHSKALDALQEFESHEW